VDRQVLFMFTYWGGVWWLRSHSLLVVGWSSVRLLDSFFTNWSALSSSLAGFSIFNDRVINADLFSFGTGSVNYRGLFSAGSCRSCHFLSLRIWRLHDDLLHFLVFHGVIGRLSDIVFTWLFVFGLSLGWTLFWQLSGNLPCRAGYLFLSILEH